MAKLSELEAELARIKAEKARREKEPEIKTSQVSSIPVKSSLANIISKEDSSWITEGNDKNVLPEDVFSQVNNSTPPPREVKDYSKTEDYIVEPFKAGHIDSTIGMASDISQGIKGGSKYQMHMDAWSDPIDSILDKQRKKEIIQDMAYMTGQQLSDIPALLGLAFVTAPTGFQAPLTFGGYEALRGGLQRKRDTGEVGFKETLKDAGKGALMGSAFVFGKGLSHVMAGGLTKIPAIVSPKLVGSSKLYKFQKAVGGTAGFVGGNEAMARTGAAVDGREFEDSERWMNLMTAGVFDLSAMGGRKINQKIFKSLKSDTPVIDETTALRADNAEIADSMARAVVDNYVEQAVKRGKPTSEASADWINNLESVMYNHKMSKDKTIKGRDLLVERLKNPEVKTQVIEDMGNYFWEHTGEKPYFIGENGKINDYGRYHVMSPEQLTAEGARLVDESYYVPMIEQHSRIQAIENIRERKLSSDLKDQSKVKEQLGGFSRKDVFKQVDPVVKNYIKNKEFDLREKYYKDHITEFSPESAEVLRKQKLTPIEEMESMVERSNAGAPISAVENWFYRSTRTAPNIIRRLGAESYRFLYEGAREAEAVHTQMMRHREKELRGVIKDLTPKEQHQAMLAMIRKQEKRNKSGETENVGEKLIQKLIDKGRIDEKDALSYEDLNPKQQRLVDHIFKTNSDLKDMLNNTRAINDLGAFKGFDEYIQLVTEKGEIPNDRALQPWFIEKKLQGKDVHKNTLLKKRFGANSRVNLDPFEVQMAYMRMAEKVINLSPVAKTWVDFADVLKAKNPAMADYIRDTGKYWAGEIADMTPGKNIIHALSNNLFISYLSMGVNTILQQPTALGNTIAEYGLANVVEAAKVIAESKIYGKDNTAKNNMLQSAVLKSAVFDASYGDLSQQKSKKKWLVDKGMAPMKMLDLISREITFETARKYYIDKGLSDKDAKFYADEAVNRTQGSGSRLDIAKMQRLAMGKLFLSFQTFAIANINYITSDMMGDDPLFKQIRVFDTIEKADSFAKEHGLEVKPQNITGKGTVYAVYEPKVLEAHTEAMLKVLRYAVFASVANTAFGMAKNTLPFLNINQPFIAPVDTAMESLYGYNTADAIMQSEKYKDNVDKPARMHDRYDKYGVRHRTPESPAQKIARVGTDVALNASKIVPVAGGFLSGQGGGATISSVNRIGQDLARAKETGKAIDYVSLANTSTVLAGNPIYQPSKYMIKAYKEMEKARKENAIENKKRGSWKPDWKVKANWKPNWKPK